MSFLKTVLDRVLGASIVRFGIVGVIGFLVDAGTLHALVQWAHQGLYAGRVGSYLAAATTTWALNRTFTFAGKASANLFAEWARFLVANLGGGAVNYATYALLVGTVSLVSEHPVIGVGAGSLAGLVLNFAASKRFVFTASRGAE